MANHPFWGRANRLDFVPSDGAAGPAARPVAPKRKSARAPRADADAVANGAESPSPASELPFADPLPALVADVIQWPMLVVDGGSHLHWANRAGMTLLAARRGLQLTTGHRVVPTQADHETHWQPALRRAASRRTSLWHAGLRATLLPLRGTAFSDASIELPMRAVILAGALPVAPDVLDDLSVAMGLTSAEREVLALLLAGQSPASIAEARQVRISTVRSQVRGLLTKVGVGSIREMVAVLAVLPAIGD